MLGNIPRLTATTVEWAFDRTGVRFGSVSGWQSFEIENVHLGIKTALENETYSRLFGSPYPTLPDGASNICSVEQVFDQAQQIRTDVR